MSNEVNLFGGEFLLVGSTWEVFHSLIVITTGTRGAISMWVDRYREKMFPGITATINQVAVM